MKNAATRQSGEGACSAFECRARHTIMSGKVVTYAVGFEGDDRFPRTLTATGHFEISASRDCVMVHRATIRTDWQLVTFTTAIHEANRMHCELAKCDGRPKSVQMPNAAPDRAAGEKL